MPVLRGLVPRAGTGDRFREIWVWVANVSSWPTGFIPRREAGARFETCLLGIPRKEVVAGDGATPSHSLHLGAFFGRRRCLGAKLRRGSLKKLHRVTLKVRGMPVLGIERAGNLDRVLLP